VLLMTLIALAFLVATLGGVGDDLDHETAQPALERQAQSQSDPSL
jgi:hypothetical protein